VSSALLLVSLLITAPCAEASAVTSPCSGVLLPTSEATRALRCLTVELPACDQRVSLCSDRAGIEKRSHEATVVALNDRILQADQALASMAKCPECERAWWDSPALGFGAGVVTTAAVVLALVLGTK